MKIGILTYGRIANFGANLQCISTYMYLLKQGHTPIYIYYLSKELFQRLEFNKKSNPQIQAHFDFFDSIVKNRTSICHSIDDINSAIAKDKIEAIIIGADAVLQHHPLLSRLKLRRQIKPFYVIHVTADRLFPNLFWGFGVDKNVKMAMMSVSCQNSEYKYFTPSLRKKMRNALKRFCCITVRDSWTQKMIHSVDKSFLATVTPDPVFAFNYNMEGFIPTKEEITAKFAIPEKYVVISMFKQSMTEKCLDDIKKLFKEKGIVCVVVPMPEEGVNFKHSFDYVIQTPLSPIDWYALIRYSKGYIGENMHPIVTCLHNAVPCYSIDNWGTTDFLRRVKNDGSSKVEDIMKCFGVQYCRTPISRGVCDVTAEKIVNSIERFPVAQIKKKSILYYNNYLEMMDKILSSLQ